MKVEGNLYINNKLEVEGKIEGYTHNSGAVSCKLLEIAGDIVSTWQLDFKLFESPQSYGKIMKSKGSKLIL